VLELLEPQAARRLPSRIGTATRGWTLDRIARVF